MTITQELYEKLNPVEHLPELEPIKKEFYWLLKCPKCDKKEAFIYFNNRGHISCNRKNECGQVTTVFDYVKQKNGHTSNAETVQFIAEKVGHELDGHALHSMEKKESERQKKQRAQNAFVDCLFSKDGAKELEYLAKRGISQDDAMAMGLGAIRQESAHGVDGIYHHTHTLSIPIKKWGQVVGWVCRTITDAQPKYLYQAGFKTGEGLFNMPTSKPDHLIIVEAPLDALHAQAKGIDNVVASYGSKLTDAQIQEIKTRLIDDKKKEIKTSGLKRIVLAFDNDRAGIDATAKAIYKLQQIGIPTQKCAVLSYPDGVKDLGEMLAKGDVIGAKNAINNATMGALWLVNQALEQHPENATDNDAMDLFGRLEPILDAFKSCRKKILEAYAMATGLDAQGLLEELEYRETLLEQEKAKEKAKEFLKKANELNDNPSELAKLWEEYGHWLKQFKPKINRAFHITTQKERAIKSLKKNNQEGFFLCGFAEKWLKIKAGAMTIIAGRPAHGKTTILINMLANMLAKYPDTSFHFFSYEESLDDLFSKLIKIMSGVGIEDLDLNLHLAHGSRLKKESYETANDAKAFLGKDEAQKRIKEAVSAIDEATSQKRLAFYDEAFCDDELVQIIEGFRGPCVVFVDYIQKIKTKNQPTRQMAVQIISEKIREVAVKTGHAIVLGAQFNREAIDPKKFPNLAQIRECGDIEQDAEMVIGILNTQMIEFEDNVDGFCQSRSDDIQIRALKNRSGRANEKASLKKHGTTWKLWDSTK